VIVAAAPSITNGCTGGGYTPGTVTAAAGDSTITVSGVGIPNGGTCTISVNVTSTQTGYYSISTSTVTTTNMPGGETPQASNIATLQVYSYPAVNVAFSPSAIGPGQVTQAVYRVSNANTALTLNNISFTNTLPANLVVASAPTTPQCGGAIT